MSEQKQSAAEAVQQIRAALVKAYNRAERNGDAQMGVYVMSAIAVLPVLEEAVRDGERLKAGLASRIEKILGGPEFVSQMESRCPEKNIPAGGPMSTPRDPRTNPKPGDHLENRLSHSATSGSRRRVIAVEMGIVRYSYLNGRGFSATWLSPRYGQPNWREWAKDAEVIHAAE